MEIKKNKVHATKNKVSASRMKCIIQHGDTSSGNPYGKGDKNIPFNLVVKKLEGAPRKGNTIDTFVRILTLG